MLHTVLFDLDGTLLPMDEKVFAASYFRTLAAKAAPLGYEPKTLIDAIWQGTAAMVKNDGACTNEEAFWRCFAGIFGEDALAHKPVFDAYYTHEFQQVRQDCGQNPKAAQTVRTLQGMGLRLVLTNPIFPAVATESRIRWAGLEPSDFALYTCYENARHAKPNPAYYQDILDRLGIPAKGCLMVGNDATEDTAAAKAGLDVFLLTDCLINTQQQDISRYPHGGFDELMAYIHRQMA